MIGIKFLVLGALLLHFGDSAKILALFPATAFSHYILGNRLLEELANRGHQVTLISAFGKKSTNKNYRDINLDGMQEFQMEFMKNRKADLQSFEQMSPFVMQIMLNEMGLMWANWTMNHPNVQKLLKSQEKFDLVIVEQFFNDALKGFCHRYKTPCVVFSTIGANQFCNHLVGNPSPPSYIPDLLLSYGTDMNFFERIYNFVFQTYVKLIQHFYYFNKQNDVMHSQFPDAPHLYDLMYNTSLILLNSDISTNQAVPHVPNMIEVGGMHVKPAKKLPEELQKFMDNAKEGVVYISFGSNLKSKDFPRATQDAILKSIAKLKMKVLWKFEDDTLANKPNNLRIEKWLPQQDILGHPNTKIFVTHGGLLSTIEATYVGIPVIGVPFFGDQKMNMERSVRNGIGIKIFYSDLTEETLTNALNELITNKKYAENAKLRSKLMHDKPMKPMDTAIFWLEYVIRHRGAPHLQISGVDLPWYKHESYDVLAVCLILMYIPVWLTCKIVKKCKGKKVCKKEKVKKN